MLKNTVKNGIMGETDELRLEPGPAGWQAGIYGLGTTRCLSKGI